MPPTISHSIERFDLMHLMNQRMHRVKCACTSREKRAREQTDTSIWYGIHIVCCLAFGRHHSINERFVASVKMFITVPIISTVHCDYDVDDDDDDDNGDYIGVCGELLL